MKNPGKATEVEVNDPDLVSLLNGTAPASLLADAIQGQFDPVAPEPAVRAEEKRQAELQDLFDRRAELTLTERLHLQRLDPRVYKEAMRQVGNGHEQQGESVEERRRFEMERQRQQAEAMAASANHAAAQIRGGTGV